MKIMVVDDELIARQMAAHTLEQAGYEVVALSNGLEALDQLHASGARIVVSDWNMPELDGLEFCRLVRDGQTDGYTYIILLTSQNRPEDIVAGLEAGADDFVTKPFNPAELTLRVNTGRRIVAMETRDLAIFAMAKLAESRDSETGAHLERVRSYCRTLVQQLRTLPQYQSVIDDEYVRTISQTSPLHDIGKVAIPDAILLKPGKLTPDEFAIMKTHTTHGAATLEAALQHYPDAQFLRMARDIALCHHERFDGSGYPRGVQGLDIPLAARILALADVYDALVSKRMYKEAFTHETARTMIIENSGRHFDPDVVQAFIASEADFLAIRQRYSNEAPTSNTAANGNSPMSLVRIG
jgi:putative two-component system response regulator